MDYGQVQWVPHSTPLPASYVFGLHTSIQSYTVEKTGQALTITAEGRYFTTPRELPREQQEYKVWKYTRTLPQGDAELEKYIARVWHAGVCELEHELHAEAVTCSMSFHIKEKDGDKFHILDLVQKPVSKKLATTYTALNERLYALFPEAQKHPASFPLSTTPPPHVKGDSWGTRLWY